MSTLQPTIDASIIQHETNTAASSGSTHTASHLLMVKTYLAITLAVFLLMMIVGVLMRAAQGAALLDIPVVLFYRLMTLHGAGMVGAAGLAGLAVNWYFLSHHVALSVKIMAVVLAMSLVAVLSIIGSIMIGGFAGAWTFLYPLPGNAMGLWSTTASVGFIAGLLLLGVAFLIAYLDMGIAISKRYGNLVRGLGVHMLFRKGPVDTDHPTTVVASSMVIVVNVIAIGAGAVVLVLTLASLVAPSITPDALLMKHLTYFFGHVFINATIYSSVTAVYEILPRYTNRPWKISKPFLAAWLAATFMVMAVYPHHLLMDFAMPTWMAAMGQIVSYTSGIPVLVVTAFGGLMLVYRSGIRWDTASSLLILSLFGWAAGVVPAVIDGIIRVNTMMHNTLWVPGHFHFYLILGLLPMIYGLAAYLVANGEQGKGSRVPVYIYAVGGIGLCVSFLISGALSVPRRFAEHESSWQWLGTLGAGFGTVLLVGTLMLAAPIVLRLYRAEIREPF